MDGVTPQSLVFFVRYESTFGLLEAIVHGVAYAEYSNSGGREFRMEQLAPKGSRADSAGRAGCQLLYRWRALGRQIAKQLKKGGRKKGVAELEGVVASTTQSVCVFQCRCIPFLRR
jgi:hypothetical protein